MMRKLFILFAAIAASIAVWSHDVATPGIPVLRLLFFGYVIGLLGVLGIAILGPAKGSGGTQPHSRR